MAEDDRFGVRLRKFRVLAGLSQDELAERSGLNVRTIRNLERGSARWPYPDTVRRLADALDLLDGTRDEFTGAAGRRLAGQAGQVSGGETAGPGPAAHPGRHEPPVPHELPGAVRDFVGRAGEMAVLSDLLAYTDQAGQGTVVISAIGGAAGVGKTALAVQWAHQAAEQFPDGQLYINLHGYDPGEPVAASDALAMLLRSLGMPGPDIPVETGERAVRYRSLLAGRRMLLVLDNARDSGQVRPLLPGTAECVTLVTSRDSLAGLVARDGARRLDLDILPGAEAAQLMLALIGSRAAEDPGATRALAEACCRLPLALRVAAELAAARPAVALTALARELEGLQRLDLLDNGADPHTSVRAVLGWSYRHLDPATARTFRLAGLCPGHDFDRYAISAVTGTGLDEAGRMLTALARAHLVQPTGADRYGMHDLLRGYSRELAALDPEEQRRGALGRLLDYYLATASAAMDAAFPAERHRRPRVPASATEGPPMTSETAAWAWLDAERASLIAAAAHAAGNDWPSHATRLSDTLFRYLDTAGLFAEARVLHGHALRAAQRSDDLPAEASALTGIGLAYAQQGRLQEAVTHFEQALTLSRTAGDKNGQARVLNYLGASHMRAGRYEDAARRLTLALELYRQTGELTGGAYALSNLGHVFSLQGDHEAASRHLKQAKAAFGDLGDRQGEASVLHRIGLARLRQGNYDQAVGGLAACLALYREFGDRVGEAEASTSLALIRARQGRHAQAIRHLRQALARFRELGDLFGETHALNGLGEVLLAAGRAPDAHGHYTAALTLARQVGEKPEQARAHEGLGSIYHAQGDDDQARQQWQAALAIYTELGLEEARRVCALLDTYRANAAACGDTGDGRESAKLAGATAELCAGCVRS
jgi:tetratricopeptide (TPR) repeat protein/DNA-binding XRE family transcriptional regulator